MTHTKQGPGHGLAPGLVSVLHALDLAGIEDSATKLTRVTVARYSRRTGRSVGAESLPVIRGAAVAGGLLATWRAVEYCARLESVGEADALLARRLTDKLIRRIEADGREVNAATRQDAIAAGALALVAWRQGQRTVDEVRAARVAWRAIVDEISADTLGDSAACPHSVDEDWLWFNRAQRDESRDERATRFRLERMAARRIQRLKTRLANLPRGRGKRAETIERIGRAATFLMQGERLDAAAELAGFRAANKQDTSGGTTTAGDRLIQAVKRLGLIGEGFAIRRARRR